MCRSRETFVSSVNGKRERFLEYTDTMESCARQHHTSLDTRTAYDSQQTSIITRQFIQGIPEDSVTHNHTKRYTNLTQQVPETQQEPVGFSKICIETQTC